MNVFYLIFTGAILLDGFLIPFLLAPPWFPSLLLSSLPFIFLFSNKKTIGVVWAVGSLFLWLIAGLNLGVSVFALGAMIFFERWLVLKFFQFETWQILISSSFSVLIFGLLVILLNGVLLSSSSFMTKSFIVSILLSTVLSIGLNHIFKRFVSGKDHEKAIF